ncbi:MAG TPA: hypothetical protein VMH79_15875 [Thermoanaerobaculia bacterium]|nr:hypothetical protein [Thermoanaerobaculia bacterium]
MKRDILVWVDHREALLASVTGEAEEFRRIESGMEKHVRYSGLAEGGAEDSRDRRFAGHLDKYYDEVIAALRDADSILILGPGEAKLELAARLRSEGRGSRLAAVETADKMTDHQVAAEARKRFRA